MDTSKSVLLWVAGFAGVALLYAAYKGQSPLSVMEASITANPAAKNIKGGLTHTANGNTSQSAVTPSKNMS